MSKLEKLCFSFASALTFTIFVRKISKRYGNTSDKAIKICRVDTLRLKY